MPNYLKANDGGDLLNGDQFFYTDDDYGRPVLNVAGAAGIAPVLKVNNKIGNVMLTTDDVPDGTDTKQLTNELKQKILDNETNITVLDSDVAENTRDIRTNKQEITAVKTALQSKQDLITGAASTAVEDNFTPDKLVVTNAAGKLEASNKGEEALVPQGGAQGQVLVKKSADDYDVEWKDATQAQVPVTSVNTKTGDVVLTQDDVGPGQTFVQTHNDFTDDAKAQIDTNKTDVATIKQQITNINTKLNQKVSKSGDTMTGSLTLSGEPTTARMAATKKYVDDKVAEALPTHTVADEDKVLSVNDANQPVWREVNEVPASTNADANKVLAVNANGDPTWVDSPPSQNGLPVGGAVGQVLVKKDGTDYNAEWKDPDGISFGNTEGNKNVVTNANGQLTTEDKIVPKPETADNGKILVANGGSYELRENAIIDKPGTGDTGKVPVVQPDGSIEYKDIKGIPTGGTIGQSLVKNSNTDYDATWQTVNGLPDATLADVGKVPTVQANGTVAWSANTSTNGIPTGGTENQVLVKNSATNYDVKWADSQGLPASTKDDADKVLLVDEKGKPVWGDNMPKKLGYFYDDPVKPNWNNIWYYLDEGEAGIFRVNHQNQAFRRERGFSLDIRWGAESTTTDIWNFAEGKIRYIGNPMYSVEDYNHGAVTISAGIPDFTDTHTNFLCDIYCRNGHVYLSFDMVCLQYSGYSLASLDAIGFWKWVCLSADDNNIIPEKYRPKQTVYGSFCHGDLKVETDGKIYARYFNFQDGKDKLSDFNSWYFCANISYPCY